MRQAVVVTQVGLLTVALMTSGGTAFDPTTPGIAVTLNGGGGQRFLFLGATASPPAGQQPGLCTAMITLSVIYQ
jgi:hypothetical protein